MREYCILNKQYSKENYEAMMAKIIKHMIKTGEWGRFFPAKFAYNGFNLSLGSFYYDETEESIGIKGGFFEREPESSTNGIDGETLPDSANGIDDSIIGKPIICADTGRVYTFIKQEVDFYRKHNMPLPMYYPERRNLERFGQLVQLKGREINCCKCNKSITTYYPDKWGYKKIFCEECYLKEVY